MAAPEVTGEQTWKELAARYGAWTLLVFYLVGAIPGVKSPVDRVTEAVAKAIADHNDNTARELEASRAIQGETLAELKAIRKCMASQFKNC